MLVRLYCIVKTSVTFQILRSCSTIVGTTVSEPDECMCVCS